VILYLEYEDDEIKDFESDLGEGLSAPELNIITISYKHGVYFR
jgi:hypothetical protein